ncbi:hypothetical protein Q31a_07950 [Aureliella helgolandensis]|uniref:Uncharacterized protein n=1 Tax=Aureliella helgolandensis TaxID=2527968 RepID=A0A518G1N8_9BACT|nr:hypothetical protein Q31a_07950 [Aureliella helgolandensis]
MGEEGTWVTGTQHLVDCLSGPNVLTDRGSMLPRGTGTQHLDGGEGTWVTGTQHLVDCLSGPDFLTDRGSMLPKGTGTQHLDGGVRSRRVVDSSNWNLCESLRSR